MLIHSDSIIQLGKKTPPNFSAFGEFGEKSLWVISDAKGIPKQLGGAYAKSNDPSTWSTLHTVLENCRSEHNELPAIALSKDSQLIFLDLDMVRDPRAGNLLLWASELLQKTNSYTEISRSGTGLHIFLRGVPPILTDEKLRSKVSNVFETDSDFELYFRNKFATITGNILVDKPIREITEAELLDIYRTFFPEKHQRSMEKEAWKLSPELSDDEVLRLAKSAKNGEKFSILFEQGQWKGSDDASAKDQSLANLVSFYTQGADQIKRLMRKSALIREKWEREDYLDRSIEKALQSLTSTYQVTKLRENSSKSPIPISLTTKTTGEPFPVSCLPKVLREMALEMKRVIKAPLELCCGGVLSASSIATRRFVKVFEKGELQHYTCFFFMILAISGERKSSVLKKALEPIYAFQDEDKERFLEENRAYRARQKAIRNEEKKILNKKEMAHEEQARVLEILQTELESYRPKPYRYLTDDFTTAALFRLLDENQGSFAVTSLDGGNVLDYILGIGPGTDGALNDSLLLKATWGDPISRDRKGSKEEGEHLFIRDPACHVTIVVPPDRCTKFLADPRLRGSGMIARILPITCVSEIGTRFESEGEVGFDESIVAEYDRAIRKFFNRTELLEVRLDEEAARARREYFNEIEQAMAVGKSLEDLRDIGSKMTTQVTRLAALFQVYKENLGEICKEVWVSKATWLEAEAVGRWIFDQAAHLQRTDYDEMILLVAKEISEKIHTSKLATDSEKTVFCKRDFQQLFKRSLKCLISRSNNGAPVNDVLGTLVSYRWIFEVQPSSGNWRSTRYRVNRNEGKEC